MAKLRDPQRIQLDAIRMGIQKMAEGCTDCAEGYFDLARCNGASEEDIEVAIRLVAGNSGRLGLSRRTFLKSAAAGAAGVAAFTVTGGLAGGLAAQPVIPAPGGRDSAWLAGPSPRGAETSAMVGVSPSGQIIGKAGALPSFPIRSLDGDSLFATSTTAAGATSGTVTDVYDAASGVLRRAIVGATVSLGRPAHDGGFDGVTEAQSADGRALALLHQTRTIVEPDAIAVTKRRPVLTEDPSNPGPTNGPVLTTMRSRERMAMGVELIDLVAGKFIDYIQLPLPDDTMLGGQVLFRNSNLYVFSFDRGFNNSVTILALRGGKLSVQRQVSNGQKGQTAPSIGFPIQPATQLLPDGRTLVRTEGAGSVQWLDLDSLQLVATIDLPCDSANPYPSTPLFAPDGTSLYIANSATTTIKHIDLVKREVVASVTLTSSSPARPYWGGAAMAPDGKTLYLIDGRGGDGLYELSLPDLTVAARRLSGLALDQVWVSSASGYVFSLGRDGRIYILDASGNGIGMVSIDAIQSLAFVR